MIVGCYTMDLYCDGPIECVNRRCRNTGNELVPPAQYSGQTRTECLALAKKYGWKVDNAVGTALCPACARSGVTPRSDV